ncbi:GspE/PulE family protein [Roseateles sp. YR242]|uniref:GspE/PulE family protein n=1 Tax=Roseateles sp. YR242 TaxID=1855305 RepID=UPI002101D134|nr:GspE/PulE family protein [Roseateles sp. YR242]
MEVSNDDRHAFPAALQAARRRVAQDGSVSVLDALRADGRWPPAAVALLLRDVGGIEALATDTGQAPDLPAFGAQAATLARQWRAVPVRNAARPDQLQVAMADPWHEASLRGIQQALGRRVTPVAASQAQLDEWLGAGSNGAAPAGGSISANALQASGPVVEFVDTALRRAYALGASDIHFECSRSGVQVRFRRDGVLVPHARLDDPRRAEEAISRIKVLAQLDITERRLPQDGRFRLALPDGDIDLRVSIIPSVFGEDAVLRLLDKAQLRDPSEQVSLDRLGFDAISAAQIRELAELPHGMLLVTGPTGSGKTTTVYAALSEVNSGLEKIITIEDPVEYELAGVLQVPVNERKGLTFAKGLRSILRHDPDRILVGEIRDAETAEIAVQSALTGHQVLTTVHANSVFDVTGRFKHFDLDMFGFMAALNGVIVQRLVRCLCQACASDRPATARELAWLHGMGQTEATSVPLAVGCDVCAGTGFKGRRVIAEVHTMDDGFRDLVTTGAPVSALREHVYRRGVKTLSSLGAEMVVHRETSAEEIKRVVGW